LLKVSRGKEEGSANRLALLFQFWQNQEETYARHVEHAPEFVSPIKVVRGRYKLGWEKTKQSGMPARKQVNVRTPPFHAKNIFRSLQKTAARLRLLRAPNPNDPRKVLRPAARSFVVANSNRIYAGRFTFGSTIDQHYDDKCHAPNSSVLSTSMMLFHPFKAQQERAHPRMRTFTRVVTKENAVWLRCCANDLDHYVPDGEV